MPALEVANLVGWVMEYEDRVGAVGRLTRNGRFVLFGAVALSASRLVVFWSGTGSRIPLVISLVHGLRPGWLDGSVRQMVSTRGW